MENDPFMDVFPIKTFIYSGLSMAMLNNQMVYIIVDTTYVHQIIFSDNYRTSFLRGSMEQQPDKQ